MPKHRCRRAGILIREGFSHRSGSGNTGRLASWSGSMGRWQWFGIFRLRYWSYSPGSS